MGGLMLNIEAIKQIIPHRYPFLLIDKIIKLEDESVTGIKQVTYNEPFFPGHFPQKAVMPGVLILEALAQTGAVLLLSKPEYQGKLALFAGINKARFKQQVLPGDTLYLEVTMIRIRMGVGIANAVAKVNDRVVCEAELMFAVE
jgi:3-hydroxyacyl-[acyl-carrier-protein] dehydratase